MDQRLKEISENYEQMMIGPNDTFRFHCTMCGKCCVNREDIILNPYDMYRASKELGITPGDFFTKYCEAYIGSSSSMVVVRLLPEGPDNRCPLLKGKRCSVHHGKPTVCALFPLGRGMAASKGEAVTFDRQEVRYFLQSIRCGDKSESFTVREYLESFGLQVQDPFTGKWFQAINDFGGILRRLRGQFSDQGINAVSTGILTALYIAYLMQPEDGQKIKELLGRHPNTDIIVHCDAGISRSAGVAAGILKAIFGDDSQIYDNPAYYPNSHCYRTTLNALLGPGTG